MRAAAFLLLCLPAAAAPAARDLVETLRTRRVSCSFEKATVEEFAKFMRAATGVNIVLKRHAIEKEIDLDAVEITLEVEDVSAADAIVLALDPHGLAGLVKGNILFFTSKKDARGDPVLVVYDVADLLFAVRDFPARDINLFPSKYQEPEDFEEPQVSQPIESSEELAELIRRFAGADTWDEEGVRITAFRRHLFIRQYPAVHREIRTLLAKLRGLR